MKGDKMKPLMVAMWLATVVAYPAFAGWVSLGGDEAAGMTIYIDASTIAKNGDRRTVWVLYDFKNVQTKEGGVSFRSAKIQREYDCVKAVTRVLLIQHFSGPMESGKKVLERTPPNQEWEAVGPLESGTVAKDLWVLACE
ncbi:MAG: hypothetical protein NZM29_05475 [Nitrospira sp.]|nr:hypothetical protein [Nitrospira sp.]